MQRRFKTLYVYMKVIIGGIETEYIVKNVKHLRIRITNFGEVVLTVPKNMSYDRAEKFFLSKKDWIVKNLSRINADNRPRELKDGIEIFIFGKKVLLRIFTGTIKSVRLCEDVLVVILKNPENLCKTVEKFLSDELSSLLKATFEKWSEITGLYSSGVTIRKTKSRWGSCTPSTKKIRMSLYLVSLPEFCIEYVTLHELLHIKYPDHGAKFHAALDHYMPNWKQIRKFMNSNGAKYKICL